MRHRQRRIEERLMLPALIGFIVLAGLAVFLTVDRWFS